MVAQACNPSSAETEVSLSLPGARLLDSLAIVAVWASERPCLKARPNQPNKNKGEDT